MKEEIIVSGRMNHLIDPQLNIWHWQIPLYLFVGGLAAGILFFAAYSFITGKKEQFKTSVLYAPIIAPFLLAIGLGALFIDLNHKAFFWQLYTTIRIESPMSWGAWTLMAITPLSLIWVAIHLKEIIPIIPLKEKFWLKPLNFVIKPIENDLLNWNWKYKWLQNLENFFNLKKSIIAWAMLVISIILGIYTGILLSAFNARPLWNTSILGPLFLTSGLSTGAAVIMLMSKDVLERKFFAKVDLVLIGIELFVITHMFMGFLASTQVQIDAVNMFLGGPYTMVFWIFVVFLGLVIPAFLEIMELKGKHIPAIIPPLLVLLGGIILRFIITDAGQASRYLY